MFLIIKKKKGRLKCKFLNSKTEIIPSKGWYKGQMRYNGKCSVALLIIILLKVNVMI